jgi:hypothetical protein
MGAYYFLQSYHALMGRRIRRNREDFPRSPRYLSQGYVQASVRRTKVPFTVRRLTVMPSPFGKEKPIVSPGGSRVYRYGELPDETDPRGVTVSEFQLQREAVYDSIFGEASYVYHEVFPAVPHIDVYVYPPRESNNYYTLVTGGMSDLPMNTPAGSRATEERPPRRVELVFYCTEPRREYLDTLRQMAHFPHAYHTWIGSGHTIPNGNPPAAFWDSSPELDTVLFMSSIVRQHRIPLNRLTLGEDPVEFLWVVPLTRAECEFKLEKGFNALLNLFQQYRHPHVFDSERKSYV